MSSRDSASVLPRRATVTWIVLVAATIVSFAMGAHHGSGSLIVPVVLAIAMVKVRLVGLDFMGLRTAPIRLRAGFECYCVAIWALLSGLYVMG